MSDENILAALFAYDHEARGLRDVEPGTIVPGDSPTELFAHISPLVAALLGCSPMVLKRELHEQLRFRMLHLLLPQACLFGNPDEDKPLIRAHLAQLGIAQNENLVRAIKFYCENFRSKRRGERRKTNITDVYVKMPGVYSEILARQGERCAACGVPLRYGENMHLDHILPWHLGDDPSDGSNWQFLCEKCNRGKGGLPYYSMNVVGTNWIRPEETHELREHVRYAVLIRDGKCLSTGKTPKEAELTVRKRTASGCWVLDNLVTCSV